MHSCKIFANVAIILTKKQKLLQLVVVFSIINSKNK